MTHAVSIVMATIAVALIGTIGFELDASDGQENVRTAAPAQPHSPALPQKVPDPQDRAQEWVATILARPLFSRDRRPPATPGQNATVAAMSMPRLAGILVSPLGRTAIFSAANGGKPIVVSEGSHLGRFVVQSIDVGQVTLMGPEGQRTLRPAFDNATAPTPPVASDLPVLRNNSGQVLRGVAN
jgi:hypothetical protein